ncbi:MAG: ParB/RepB/Spo0J family partition protein [Candidatus Omnitrophica bacterium]|nr:ParB/RepB/Spo0J family partition protein [Candidatus Omnitrophota bacterium]
MTSKALGKGLSALIPTRDDSQENRESVLRIPISKIRINKYQPRLEFNKEKLDELTSSIKEKGVVQPVLVRASQDGYELIAGERRLRAVTNLGMESIPAIVKNVADIDMLELSLIENIQREELNPMEEASAFQKFITDFNFTQERIATAVGKDRSTVANTLRLLTLPKKIQDFISKGSITAGHAKAILSVPTENDRLRVCNLVVKKGLSVRETEALAARRAAGETEEAKVREKDQDIADLENKLQQFFGTKVKIFHGNKRGRIQIEYYSTEDLNRILELFSPKPQV